jgi:histidinol phosphatase-like enzyme
VPIGENEVDARKPEPGLLMQSAHDFNLDLSKSTGVGDQWSDVVAFKYAGLRNSVLVTKTGRNAEDRPTEDDGIRPDFVVDDRATAVETIVVPDEKPAALEFVSNRSADVFIAA